MRSPSPLVGRNWLVVGLVSLGVAFTSMDQTVVVTVLPEIMLDMEIPLTELDHASWIITGYLIGFTVAIPLVARLGDVYGYARLFRLSLVLFALSSVLVAISPNLPCLVGARVLQAIGAGAIVPIGIAIVCELLPSHKRAVAIGIVGASAEIGVVLGPLYGGIITQALGWRWLFWLDVPQAAIILVSLSGIHNTRQPGTRVDYRGGILLAIALTTLILALSQKTLFTFSSPVPYLLAGLGILTFLVLIWTQVSISQPLLPPRFFKSWVVISGLFTKFLTGAAFIIAMVTVPLMMNTVLGQNPLEGGLTLMRLTGAVPVGALLGGIFIHRSGARRITITGLMLAATGLFFMSGWDLNIRDPALSLHLAMTGLGFGLVIAPILITTMDAVPNDYNATTASMVAVTRMIGMSIGLAALSAWGMQHFQVLTTGLDLPIPLAGETSLELEQRTQEYLNNLNMAGITVFHSFFRVAAILTLAGILPALGLKTNRKISNGNSSHIP